MASKKAILTAMAALASVFAGDVTNEKVAMYTAALQDLSDEQVAASVAMLVKTHTGQFIPVPAQIREACGANAKPSVDTAKLLRDIDKAGSYNANVGWSRPRVEKIRELFGPQVAYAVAEVGISRLFADNDTTRDIALRDFQRVLAESVPETGLSLPAARDFKSLAAGDRE